MTDPKKAPKFGPDSAMDLAHAYLAAIIRSSNDAIISKNLNGIITSWNQAAESIFGYTEEEAIGQHISLIIPEDRLHEETHIITSLRLGKSIDHFETVRRAKDGRLLDLSITVSPIRDNSGVIIGASKVARDITEKKRTERLLREANEELERRVAERTAELQKQSAFLKAVLDSINDGIATCDENGVLNMFNRATQELHSQPSAPLPPEEWADHFHLYYPDGVTPMKPKDIPLLRALREGKVSNLEMVVAPPGEAPRVLVASGQSLYDEQGKKFGAVVSMHDITEQKKQQAALVESRTFLRTIIDTVADPIFVKDEDHRWIEGNRAFWDLVGPEEEIRGKTDHDLFPKEQADKFWEGDNRIFASGQPHDAEEKLRSREGEDITIITRKMPLTMDNGKKALVGIIRDITQQRQFEEELREHRNKLQELVHLQTKDLIEAKERAELSNKNKTEFLANMSHEIRTPMNAVLGISQILKDGRHSPDKQQELLNTLSISAHQIMELINDLLDVSKIQDSSFSLSNEPFDLQAVIGEVVDINKIEAQNKKILLEYNYVCPVANQFVGDPVRLRQVIMNLTGNALKFTSEGFVRINVECKPSATENIYTIEISVIDSGVGIPADRMDKIFERFVQADSSIAKKFGGTGLGLSISRQLAEMMGGNISVKSESGRGSTFTLRIPLAIAGEPVAAADGDVRTGGAAAGQSTRARILLVEDYEPNILVTGMLLEGFGYDYIVASNGKDALDRLNEGGIDLVLMDVQMPIMDGFTATRLWRVQEAVAHKSRLPIIGMTAHALEGDRERCEVSGMDQYVSKPFDAADLRQKIESLLEKKRLDQK